MPIRFVVSATLLSVLSLFAASGCSSGGDGYWGGWPDAGGLDRPDAAGSDTGVLDVRIPDTGPALEGPEAIIVSNNIDDVLDVAYVGAGGDIVFGVRNDPDYTFTWFHEGADDSFLLMRTDGSGVFYSSGETVLIEASTMPLSRTRSRAINKATEPDPMPEQTLWQAIDERIFWFVSNPVSRAVEAAPPGAQAAWAKAQSLGRRLYTKLSGVASGTLPALRSFKTSTRQLLGIRNGWFGRLVHSAEQVFWTGVRDAALAYLQWRATPTSDCAADGLCEEATTCASPDVDCCDSVFDCSGTCGGTETTDCAGLCGGSTEVDCAGVCGGTETADCAGLCGGVTEVDCAGVCGGGAEVDCMGVCDGSTCVTGEWMSEFGSRHLLASVDVGGDGSVLVAGSTDETVEGRVGEYDGVVRKYDAAGNELWTRLFGTSVSATIDAYSVSVGSDGSVLVAGDISGALPGQTSAGVRDVFVRKYDAAGTELWTRQFGTFTGDYGHSVSVDIDGSVLVAGSTFGTLPGQSNAGSEDAFVRKYNAAGSVVWTRQFGTVQEEQTMSVSIGSDGSVVVAGITYGQFGGTGSEPRRQYAFVRKYDADGNEVWTRQFVGAAGLSVSVGSDGSVLVAGRTDGTLPGQTSAGGDDAFVRKYDAGGTEVWTRQFGTASFDVANSVSVGNDGSVFVAGSTLGALPGQSSGGGSDPFVRKYDAAGNELWTRQFGTAQQEDLRSVSVRSDGNVLVAGSASDLGGIPRLFVRMLSAP